MSEGGFFWGTSASSIFSPSLVNRCRRSWAEITPVLWRSKTCAPRSAVGLAALAFSARLTAFSVPLKELSVPLTGVISTPHRH